MARRLVRVFVFLVAVPLIVTVVTLGLFGQEQIVWTVNTMEENNASAVLQANTEFQKLGSKAVHQSSEQTQQISIDAVKSVTDKLAKIQSASLAATARDFSALTKSSSDSSMNKSLSTQKNTLSSVRDEMTTIFAQSSSNAQKQAAGNIEKAMLLLIDALMRQRAEQLALSVNDHLANAASDLTITAQMPDLRDGNIQGQKAILDALVRRFPQMTEVSVMDKHGRETAMSSSTHAVTSADLGQHAGDDFFVTAMNGKEYIGLANSSKQETVPRMILAVPIELYRGKVVGVLAAYLSLDELWDRIRNTRIGQQGFAYVLDEHDKPLLKPNKTSGDLLNNSATVENLKWRVVVAIPRSEAVLPILALKNDIAANTRTALKSMSSNLESTSRKASTHLQKEAVDIRNSTQMSMQERSHDVFKHLMDTTASQTRARVAKMQIDITHQTRETQKNNDQLMAKASSDAADGLTSRIQPLLKEAVSRANSRIGIVAILILAGSCAVSWLLAMFTAGRIVRPVVHLAKVTDEFANGNLEVRVDESADDEIGDLSKAFNSMAASLQQSQRELTEAEGQLVHSAKLASLGTLSAGVAHELNQPVAIIRGIAQQLAAEDGLSEELRSDLELIEKQTGRMVKIIRHLRTFSRAGGADHTLVDINQVAKDCLILIGEQLRAHNIEMEFILCDSLPRVLGDSNELEQVFINLITNARDALEDIPNAKITVSSQFDESNYTITIRDNGTGIPESVISKIFDPFFTTKEPGKGTGLGLSISHSIIQKHHGELRVHNDGGAVFTVTLPMAVEKELPEVEKLPTAA